MDRNIVIEAPPQHIIVEVGIQGPPGPPGLSRISGVAGTALSGHRAVVAGTDGKFYYASSADAGHAGRVAGITAGAVTGGDAAEIQTYGVVMEPSWNWDMMKNIYLGVDGALTQTAPDAGIVVRMGFPMSATSMFVDIGVGIVLA